MRLEEGQVLQLAPLVCSNLTVDTSAYNKQLCYAFHTYQSQDERRHQPVALRRAGETGQPVVQHTQRRDGIVAHTAQDPIHIVELHRDIGRGRGTDVLHVQG
jgi:hypothetical protein